MYEVAMFEPCYGGSIQGNPWSPKLGSSVVKFEDCFLN